MVRRVEFFFDLASACSELVAFLVPYFYGSLDAHGIVHPPSSIGRNASSAPCSSQMRPTHPCAEYYGLPMRFPEPFPIRTLKSMRAAMWCAAEGEPEAFAREAFALYWEEGGAPKGLEEADEDGPLREVARRSGADLLEGAATNGAKEATTAAVSTEIVGNLKVREHHQRRTSSPRSSFFGAMSRSESRTNWRKSRKCY